MKTKEPRSILKILELMRDNIFLLTIGLCNLSYKLYEADIITYTEHRNILGYIHCNKPKKSLISWIINKSHITYIDLWYPEGHKFLRKLWLKRQIKKLKANDN